MPNPGQANNPAGINDFSGPYGEQDPAYGDVARSKVLEQGAPTGVRSPDSIAKTAQRKGSRQQAQPAPPEPAISEPHQPTVDAAAQSQQFWVSVLNDPEASDLTREYAQRALNGG